MAVYFQVNISPLMKKSSPPHVKKIVGSSDDVDIVTTSLAPFTANPKVFFDGIIVGHSATRRLSIQNTASQTVQLQVTKSPAYDKYLTLSWTCQTVGPNENVLLDFIWNPKKEESWAETIIIEGGKRIRKDVQVLCKSISTKKKRGKAASNRKSPQKKIFCNTRIRTSPRKLNASPKGRKKISTPGKENQCQVNKSNSFHTPSQMSFNIDKCFEFGRETFVMNELPTIRKNNSPVNFRDSLEPETEETLDIDVFNRHGCNILDKFSELKFTPGTGSNGYLTPINKFVPSRCSTNKTGNQSNCVSPNARVLNCSNDSNISTSTYVKGNLSGATYTVDIPNVSRETYVVESRTDQSFDNSDVLVQRNLQSSSIRNVLEGNLWTNSNVKSPTGSAVVSRENELLLTRKRKANIEFISYPAKQKFMDENEIEEQEYCTSFRSLRASIKPPVKALKLKQFIEEAYSLRDIPEEKINQHKKCVILHNPNECIRQNPNPFLLATTNHIDPFLSPSLFYDSQWIDEQIESFKKWLNALLTPPSELSTNTTGIDVAKLWQQCKKLDNVKAPTNENMSNKYHVNSRLDLLRRSAIELFRSRDICSVLAKVASSVDSGKLEVRRDRKVHLDLAIQYEIICLFMCYNTLWLRIGLETIFGMTIPLHSNTDQAGLVHFIIDHMFKDAYLLKKYKSNQSPKYITEISKHVLQKFLTFVYFVDKAKCRKLISHDPCLFVRNSEYKESREILLRFAREVIASIGDITRLVKPWNYVLEHKQTYIHEFEYAVNHIGVDLRDGVRLARVMEIVLLVDGLTAQLRLPAISRLQKVHNVKISFTALQNAGFEIHEDIEPRDIADGHKEKTLSFLWQIVHKFQAPRLTKATITIQYWWRSVAIVMKRRRLLRAHNVRQKAAITVQKWYRQHIRANRILAAVPRIQCEFELRRQHRAALKIQSYYRMYKCNVAYLRLRYTITGIQCYARKYLISEVVHKRVYAAIIIQSNVRAIICRRRFIALKNAVVKVERYYKAKREMQRDRQYYLKLRESAIIIQRRYRATIVMCAVRHNFIERKRAVIILQQRYRAAIAMAVQRDQYVALHHCTRHIQDGFRAILAMRRQRMKYLALKSAACCVQLRFRATIAMIAQRDKYTKLKNAAITIQRRYRANKSMRDAQHAFVTLKTAAIAVQNRHRANMKMRVCRAEYLKVKIAAIVLQRRYRALCSMRSDRLKFTELKSATVILQARFRAVIARDAARQEYHQLRASVIFVQRKFRAKHYGEKQRAQYVCIKQWAVFIQKRYRANKSMLIQRHRYCVQKHACVLIQRKYRAVLEMRIVRMNYQLLLYSVKIVQQKYRAKLQMRHHRSKYLELQCAAIKVQTAFRRARDLRSYCRLKRAVLCIQHRFRAKLQRRKTELTYSKLKSSVIAVQRRFRANKTLHLVLSDYQTLRNAVIRVQTRFRANCLMKTLRGEYLQTLAAARTIQCHYRSYREMKRVQESYQNLKRVVAIVEDRYRATRAMRLQQVEYQSMRRSSVEIQRFYRAMKEMIAVRSSFVATKEATLFVQRRYRAKRAMQAARLEYTLLRNNVIKIQSLVRAQQAMIREQHKFVTMRTSAILIQNWYRAQIEKRIAHTYYLKLKNSSICVQQKWRALVLMRRVRAEFTQRKRAASVIQQRWRAKQAMISQRDIYLKSHAKIIVIQRWYRACKQMQFALNYFSNLRKATLQVQRRYRATQAMVIERAQFQLVRKAVTLLQDKWRATVTMRIVQTNYLQLREATVIVQMHYRAKLSMIREHSHYVKLITVVIKLQQTFRAKQIRRRYLTLRHNTLVIQKRFRAQLAMKCCRNQYQLQRSACVVLQRAYRSIVVMHHNYTEYQLLKGLVVGVQTHARGFLARLKYAYMFDPDYRAEVHRKRVETCAAIRMQAAWRGYLARLKWSAVVRKIRRSNEVRRASGKMNKLTIAERKSVTLRNLKKMTILQVLDQLQEIDFLSQTCRTTCLELSDLLPEYIFQFILSATRSATDMKSISLCTSILISFYKARSDSLRKIADVQWFDRILAVMTFSCDKECDVFLNSCTLLWLCAHNETLRSYILQIPNISQWLRKMKTSIERKCKMVSNSANSFTSAFIYTPSEDLYLPSLTPSWGLDYDHRPRRFKNSLFALDSFVKLLNSEVLP